MLLLGVLGLLFALGTYGIWFHAGLPSVGVRFLLGLVFCVFGVFINFAIQHGIKVEVNKSGLAL